MAFWILSLSPSGCRAASAAKATVSQSAYVMLKLPLSFLREARALSKMARLLGENFETATAAALMNAISAQRLFAHWMLLGRERAGTIEERVVVLVEVTSASSGWAITRTEGVGTALISTADGTLDADVVVDEHGVPSAVMGVTASLGTSDRIIGWLDGAGAASPDRATLGASCTLAKLAVGGGGEMVSTTSVDLVESVRSVAGVSVTSTGCASSGTGSVIAAAVTVDVHWAPSAAVGVVGRAGELLRGPGDELAASLGSATLCSAAALTAVGGGEQLTFSAVVDVVWAVGSTSLAEGTAFTEVVVVGIGPEALGAVLGKMDSRLMRLPSVEVGRLWRLGSRGRKARMSWKYASRALEPPLIALIVEMSASERVQDLTSVAISRASGGLNLALDAKKPSLLNSRRAIFARLLSGARLRSRITHPMKRKAPRVVLRVPLRLSDS